MRIVSRGMAITIAALSLAGRAAAAPVETMLHSFTGSASDGAGPWAGLIADEQGTLYGTTYTGGSAGSGTVFKLTPPKGQAVRTETVLYSFQGSASDGGGPVAGLIFDKEGALYGTTFYGGNNCTFGSCGTIFKLTPPRKGQTAWTESMLYKFQGGPSDGAYPGASLIFDKEGALYGTTVLGGSGCSQTGGCGAVFKLTPPANGKTTWTESVLYSFTDGSDGGRPVAGLIFDKEGALYSTTFYGGNNCTFGSCGTIFKLTPPRKGQTAWTESVLYKFCSQPNCSDGTSISAGLIFDKEGALYGATIGGGSGCSQTGGCGTVFKLTPPAQGQTTWTERVLYSFEGGPSDGNAPEATLIADKEGALYGATIGGGSGCSQTGGCGTVFKLTPPANGKTTWTESVLYILKGPGSDGAIPFDYSGLIADKEGALYGTTYSGGSSTNCANNNGCGTVFKLPP